MNSPENEPAPALPEKLALEDMWIVSQFNTLIREVTDNLEKFELGIAVQKLYDFIWDVLCDWYIELCKIRLQAGGEAAAQARAVLVFVLSSTLQLLHPFMPFITEEIWQTLPHAGESIMISEWPRFDEALAFPEAEEEMNRIMAAIRGVRNRRAEMNVPPSRKAAVYVATQYEDTFRTGSVFFERLASASHIEVGTEWSIEGAVSVVTDDARIFIPMEELVDVEAELARLSKEQAAAEKNLANVMAKLSNEGFLAKAPEAVVQNQRDTAQKLREKLAMLEESIRCLRK